MVPRLRFHVGLYALVLVAMLALVPFESSLDSDEGAYGGQVFALRQGQWALPRPLPVVDQAHEGWFNTAITPEGPTPYTANPGYSILLTAVVRLVHGPPQAGETARSFALGLHVLPLLGALLSAWVAWLLAGHWNPRAAPLAFWLLALGPVLINSTTLRAHTLTTALGGLALLLTVKALTPTGSSAVASKLPARTLGLAAAAVVALGAAATLRTEALFWILAVTVAAVTLDRSRRTIATVGVGSLVASSAWLASQEWGQALRADKLPIETSIEALKAPTTWAGSRIPAGWQLLATSLSKGPGPLLTLLALAVAALVVVRLRSGGDADHRWVTMMLLLAASGLYLIRLIVAPASLIAGVLGAWPLVVLLLLAQRRPDSSSRARSAPWTRALLVPSAVLTLLVLATQYAGSGGLQWGGRYLSMAFAPLAAAAALGGEVLFRRYRLPMTMLLVAPAVVGVMATMQLRQRHQEVVEAATSEPSEVVVTEILALPRIGWAALPTAFYRSSPAGVDQLLAQLAEAGVASVNIHGLGDVEVDGVAGYRQVVATTEIRHLVLESPVADSAGTRPSPEVLASDP